MAGCKIFALELWIWGRKTETSRAWNWSVMR